MPRAETVETPVGLSARTDADDPPYLITAADFQRMVDAEVLPADRRIYLWDGVLHEKMAKKQAHAIPQNKLNAVLVKRLPDGWFVSLENPLNLGMTKTPLPDLAIVRGTPDDYPDHPPHGTDTALVVEVANTSLRKDREAHLRACAAAGVPAYWVVDVPSRVVWVHSRPARPEGAAGETSEPSYSEQARVEPGGILVLELPGRPPVLIEVDEILPRSHH